MFTLIFFGLLLSSLSDTVYGKVVIEVQADRWNCDTEDSSFNYSSFKNELYQHVANTEYEDAVDLTKAADRAGHSQLISETVQKLLESHDTARSKVMSYAYKLWTSAAKDIVQRSFPFTFKNILDQDIVKIVNKGYGQALKMEVNTDRDGDRGVWGDSNDKTSNRVSWKFIPVWENNEVTFKIYNLDRNMYMKLAVDADRDGDRRAYGSNNPNTDRHKFYLEPHSENGEVVFFIINYQYRQGLKLVVAEDNIGDRSLVSHNGDIYANVDRFKWIISLW